jgi:hypothetical protein
MRKPALKTVLLAAASAAAAAGVSHAAPPAATPIHVEQTAPAAQPSTPPDEAARRAPQWMCGAALALAIAALIRLLGLRRLATAAKAGARAVGAAAHSAARGALRLVASPIRFFLVLASLALIVAAGLDVSNLEWAAGLVLGGLIAASVVFGMRRRRRRRPS